jgi:hypothetical protein
MEYERMMRTSLIAVTLLAGLPLLPQQATAGADMVAERRRFAACPGADALARLQNVSWSPQSSRLDDHRKLREELRAPLPEGRSRILYWSHQDAPYFDVSLVAVRHANGRWHVTQVGEAEGGIAEAGMARLRGVDGQISVKQGRALDKLLADPCLYAAPTFQAYRYPGGGGEIQTLEIETPKRKRVASWVLVNTPQQQAVIDLLTVE